MKFNLAFALAALALFPCAAKPVERVIFVSKTHLDLGFTKLPHEVVEQFRTNHFPKALSVARTTAADADVPPYRWTVPSWLLVRCADDPAVLEGARAGTLAWHAMPMTLLTSLAGREDIVRGLGYAKRLSELTGRRSYAAKLTDVPGHPWALPDILSANGIKFLHIGSNDGHKSPDVPPVFWWEGPAGGRVLTVYSKVYGSGSQPWAGWPFSAWLAMDMTGDNTGPLDERTYREKIRRTRAANPGAVVTCGTLEDFYDAVSNELGCVDLPVVRSDLGNVWDFCCAGFPGELRRMREVRRRVCDLEATARRTGRLTDEVCAKIAEIYEELIVLDEHSWGGDYKEFLHGWNRRNGKVWQDEVPAYRSKEAFRRARETSEYRRLEKSWQAKRDHALAAERLVDELAVLLDGGALVLENDCLKVMLDVRTGGISSLYDKRLKREFIRKDDPCGIYVYDVFDNNDLEAYLRTASKSRFDWWNADFGRIGYPKDFRHYRSSPTNFTARTVRRDARATVVELTCRRSDDDVGCRKYGDAREIAVRYSLLVDEGALDVELALRNGDAQFLVECGSMRFPFALTGPVEWRFNTMGCVTDPSKDYARDSGHAIYTLEEWMDVYDAQGGVKIFAPDTPLVMRGGNDIYVFRSEPDPAPKPEAWFNLFFSKQHRKWFEKDFTYRFRLEPHGRVED